MVLAVHVGRDDAPIETKRVPKLIKTHMALKPGP